MSISALENSKRYHSAVDGPSRGGRSPMIDLEDLRLVDRSRGMPVVLRCISLSGCITDGADPMCWLSADSNGSIIDIAGSSLSWRPASE